MLGALLRDPLGHGNGRNAARLSADDIGHLLGGTLQGSVQDELRNLGGLPTPAAKYHQIKKSTLLRWIKVDQNDGIFLKGLQQLPCLACLL